LLSDQFRMVAGHGETHATGKAATHYPDRAPNSCEFRIPGKICLFFTGLIFLTKKKTFRLAFVSSQWHTGARSTSFSFEKQRSSRSMDSKSSLDLRSESWCLSSMANEFTYSVLRFSLRHGRISNMSYYWENLRKTLSTISRTYSFIQSR